MSLIFSNSYAQDKDSLSVSVKNRNFAADSVARYLYDVAKKRPYLASILIPVNFNKVTVGHQIANGNFIAAQSASKSQNTYLLTEGRTMLKDVSLWGSFSYQKSTEDSTRWAQQTRNNVSSPYYYGSPANINYQRSVYNFNGTAERNMIKGNLPIALGVDYRIGDHYATNDPRGAVADFQLNLLASVGNKFTNSLQTGLVFKYGYGQERTRVDYKNKAYFETSAFPDYINYVVNGYGEPIPKNNDRRFDNDQHRKGLEGYLLFNNNNLGNFILTTSYIKESQLFNFKSTNSALIKSHNDYKINTLNADLIWKKSILNKDIILAVNYANADGSDYNYTINSNNYLYNYNSMAIKTILSVKGKTNYNYSFELTKRGEERQDGLNGNLVNYNNLIVKCGAGFIKQRHSQSWGINLIGFYSLPLDDQFLVPVANEKIFTKGVIYHDYLFNTASYLGGSLSGDYNFPTYNKIQTGIKLGLDFVHNLQMKTLDRSLSSIPGNNRLSANISLNLYF